MDNGPAEEIETARTLQKSISLSWYLGSASLFPKWRGQDFVTREVQPWLQKTKKMEGPCHQGSLITPPIVKSIKFPIQWGINDFSNNFQSWDITFSRLMTSSNGKMWYLKIGSYWRNRWFPIGSEILSISRLEGLWGSPGGTGPPFFLFFATMVAPPWSQNPDPSTLEIKTRIPSIMIKKYFFGGFWLSQSPPLVHYPSRTEIENFKIQ